MASVGDTAFLVAALRAQESARPDALFVDHLAARLAGEPGRLMLQRAGTRGEMAAWSVVMRTLIIDRFIKEAIDRGAATIVNLGAGLDTRPYRMPLPASLLWIEVDQDAVIAHKRERLSSEAPRCRLERVGLDLLDSAARNTFFARVLPHDAPALAIAEGVFPYFEEEEVARLLDDLRRRSAVQDLIVDYIAPDIVRARNARSAGGTLAVPMRFAPTNWQRFFATHGWRVRHVRNLADEGVRCGRPFVGPEQLARGSAVAYAILKKA